MNIHKDEAKKVATTVLTDQKDFRTDFLEAPHTVLEVKKHTRYTRVYVSLIAGASND